MDLNEEYAAHQRAIMRADQAGCSDERIAQLARASFIAGRINAFQRQHGAAASALNITKVPALARA